MELLRKKHFWDTVTKWNGLKWHMNQFFYAGDLKLYIYTSTKKKGNNSRRRKEIGFVKQLLLPCWCHYHQFQRHFHHHDRHKQQDHRMDDDVPFSLTDSGKLRSCRRRDRTNAAAVDRLSMMDWASATSFQLLQCHTYYRGLDDEVII